MSRTNAWHEAICTQLSTAGGPLLVEEIWRRMDAAGFPHRSRAPRGTLGARIYELVQMKKIERVGPATYSEVSS